MHLPDKWKIGPSQKYLLVRAMGGAIPPEIIQRPKKGFTFPWHHWLRNELKSVVDTNMEYLADRDEFNGSVVLRLWNAFLSN